MEVYVAGVGMTKVGEHWEKGIVELAGEAALRAIEDANVRNIDYIIVTSMVADAHNRFGNLANAVADYIGFHGVPSFRVEAACASGGVGVNTAYEIVKGSDKTVLVIGVEKLSDFTTAANTSAMMLAEDWTTGASIGATFVSLNALALRYYLEKFHADHDSIMMLPVICHEHAIGNPYAQFRRKISLEDVKKSPVIADPMHLLEASAYGDGAAALVLSPKKADVEIIASTLATDQFRIANRDDPLTFKAVKKAAVEAYAQAKIGPTDIGIMEIHDAFSITGVIALEDLGFAEKGEGWKLIKREEISLNGRLPTNTFGGLKARGHPVGATGIYQIVEITLQLRGEAGTNQVDSPRIGLAENIGGIATTATIHILRRKEY